jgi:signal transduction histidine kinase
VEVETPHPRGRRVRPWAIFEYRSYSPFTWSWSWRRSIVFGVFAVAFGVWRGISNALQLDDWHIGLATASLIVPLSLVLVSLGPLVAAWVRSCGWPKWQERIGVVLAVVAGMLAGDMEEWIGNWYFKTAVVPIALEKKLISPDQLVRVENSSHGPLVWIAGTVLFFFPSGGLALAAYFGEQRRLLEEARKRQLGEIKLQKEQADLRLLVLQAQVEPHFLFNTLASLRSLLRQDVNRAESTVDALVEHLRSSMPVFRGAKKGSTLADQLRLCASYLELMMVRMSDRLSYGINLPKELEDTYFPPLLLITLVENAIKHGIEPKPGPGRIRIDARREMRSDGAYVVVDVEDNGRGLTTGLGNGVGLANIRAQLALKYGDRALFSLAGGSEGGAVATIAIPESGAEET